MPFLLKDLLDNFEGEPITCGSRGINMVCPENSELVNRYLKSGVIPFGKTNTPEFGLIVTTEPKAHGATHNPWRQGLSCGGSSGGSAVAVTSGMVPIASGGDGGGSIRFPAANCGIVGLKPSRGLNPSGPDFGDIWDGFVACHILSRSVRDTAAMLDVTAGPEVGAPYRVIPNKTNSFLSATQEDPKPLRIAYSSQSLTPGDIHPEAIKGLEKTVSLLENLGHQVEEASPQVNIEQCWKDFLLVTCAHANMTAQQIKKQFGKKARRQLEPMTKNMAMLGRSFSAGDFVMAKQRLHEISLTTGLFLQNYDAYLTPTMTQPPVAMGSISPTTAENWLLELSSHIPRGEISASTRHRGSYCPTHSKQYGILHSRQYYRLAWNLTPPTLD